MPVGMEGVDVEDVSRLRRCVRAISMQAMAVDFPEVEGHPNRLPFQGCLTVVDEASDRAPNGSRGHRVILSRDAAREALPSLLGMAVDYKAGWDGHNARQKCGIITAAHLEPKGEGKRLLVSGYLFARDFPEFGGGGRCRESARVEAGAGLPKDAAMGMSYELADAHVEDMRAPVWRLTRATFTGAAILLREKAAYRGTSFRVGRSGGQGLASGRLQG